MCYVRVVRGQGSVAYQAVGVGHRGPRTVPLSARRAAALIGSVPFVEVHRRAPAADVVDVTDAEGALRPVDAPSPLR